jgi:hypothetical protein
VKPYTITKRGLIRQVASRWRKRYSKREKTIYDALSRLDLEHCTDDDVAKIIGNRSWTCNLCYACGRDVDAVVMVGEDQVYDRHTTTLCVDCIADAVYAIITSGKTESDHLVVSLQFLNRIASHVGGIEKADWVLAHQCLDNLRQATQQPLVVEDKKGEK